MEKFTSDSVKNFETEVDYTTVLDNFEGPLDLLLHLIKREQIEIKDIFVSQVTEQFLAYMQGLPYIDLDKASEYLNIAATIIDIKARSLLPPPDDGLDDYYEEDDDPKQDLIHAIEEYQMIKEGADKLKEMETVGYYFKEPDKYFSEVQVKYKDLTLDGLVKALTEMMLKRDALGKPKATPRKIPKDKYTVKEKIVHIRQSIKAKDSLQFEELFAEDVTVAEVVTTFQALLELLKHQFIIVEQPELFASITIKKNPNRSEEEDVGEIDEYN
ncbi:MAG: segregation/condensation protein A [Clostridia bacterium]|nr:segregation/condensation protein A [Clostridia bacterium]